MKTEDVNGINSAVIALVSFFILTPFAISFVPKGSEITYQVTGIPLGWMGSKGNICWNVYSNSFSKIVCCSYKKRYCY